MSVRKLRRDRSRVIAAVCSVIQHGNGRNLHAIDVPRSNHVSRANTQLLIFGHDRHSRLKGINRKRALAILDLCLYLFCVCMYVRSDKFLLYFGLIQRSLNFISIKTSISSIAAYINLYSSSVNLTFP